MIELLERSYGEQVLFSLMCQYIPMGRAQEFAKLNRKLTHREYEKVKTVFRQSRLNGFTQFLSSADEKYVPEWDY